MDLSNSTVKSAESKVEGDSEVFKLGDESGEIASDNDLSDWVNTEVEHQQNQERGSCDESECALSRTAEGSDQPDETIEAISKCGEVKETSSHSTEEINTNQSSIINTDSSKTEEVDHHGAGKIKHNVEKPCNPLPAATHDDQNKVATSTSPESSSNREGNQIAKTDGQIQDEKLVPWGDEETCPYPDEEKSPIFEERIKRATELKEEGNNCFKDSNFSDALDKYSRALYHIDFDELSFNFELMDAHRDVVLATRLPLYLNSAACKLQQAKASNEGSDSSDVNTRGKSSKESNPDSSMTSDTKTILAGVVSDCSEALKCDEKCAKAMYRRAVAYEMLGNVDKAREDVNAALKICPDDRAIIKLVRKLALEAQEARHQADEAWKGKLVSATSNTKVSTQSVKPDNENPSNWIDSLKSPFVWLLEFCKKTTKAD